MPDILHLFQINAPPEKVFRAFASPEGLMNWWPAKSAGELRSGATFTFWFSPEYDWRGQVTHFIPEKEITWKLTQASDDWVGTEVGIKLSGTDVATVSFFHKGWAEASDHFQISNFCWAILLLGLKNYVETGTIIPPEQRR